MTFKIVGDRLHKGGAPVSFVPSPNIGRRMQPVAIIVHDTAGPSAISAINTFKKATGTNRVSAHFVVDFDGEITQMVDCDIVAWHAGRSVLNGRSGCNNFTIGIEMVNPGKLNDQGHAWFYKPGQSIYAPVERKKTGAHGDGYWLPYPEEQFQAVVALCKALTLAYPTIKSIHPHWEISPRRKIDPNPLFKLEDLRAAVFSPAKPQSESVAAIWPLKVGSEGPVVEAVQRRLLALKYATGSADKLYGARTRAAVLAFEAENGLLVDGELSAADRDVLESAQAKPMPTAVRSATTVADLKAAGSETVTITQKAKARLKLLFAGTASVAADDQMGLGFADSAIAKGEQVKGLFSRSGDLLGGAPSISPRIVIAIVLAGALFAVWRWFDIIEKRRVEDARSGAHLGR